MTPIPTFSLASFGFDYSSGCWFSYDVCHSALQWLQAKLGPEWVKRLELSIEPSGAAPTEYRIHSAAIADGDGYFWPQEAMLSAWLLEAARMRTWLERAAK